MHQTITIILKYIDRHVLDGKIFLLNIKGRVHCFSMQVVMNKCFLLKSGKKLAQIRLVVFKKNAKIAHLIPKNDVTEPKAGLLL